MSATLGGQLWCTISCDSDGCDASHGTPSGTPTRDGPAVLDLVALERLARQRAHRHGWLLAIGCDLCPEHKGETP